MNRVKMPGLKVVTGLSVLRRAPRGNDPCRMEVRNGGGSNAMNALALLVLGKAVNLSDVSRDRITAINGRGNG